MTWIFFLMMFSGCDVYLMLFSWCDNIIRLCSLCVNLWWCLLGFVMVGMMIMMMISCYDRKMVCFIFGNVIVLLLWWWRDFCIVDQNALYYIIWDLIISNHLYLISSIFYLLFYTYHIFHMIFLYYLWWRQGIWNQKNIIKEYNNKKNVWI